MAEMLEKLKVYENNYKKLVKELASPEVSSNPLKIKEYGKKISELEGIVKISGKYGEVISSIHEAEGMLEIEKDEEMKKFLKEELNKNIKDVAFGSLYQGKTTYNFRIPYKSSQNCFRSSEV